MPKDALEKKNDFIAEIDNSIDLATRKIIGQISEDRNKAETFYQELLSLFNQGKNSPADLRELNSAQEKLQHTTDQLQKLMDTMVRIKTGDTKIQIAQFNNSDGESVMSDKAKLIEFIEASQDKDNVIDVEFTDETKGNTGN